MSHFLNRKSKLLPLAMLASVSVLSACSDSDDPAPAPMVTFEVTVNNLTAGQPLSPLAVILHDNAWSSFATGEASSVDLEYLAEAGDNSHIIDAADADAMAYTAESGVGIIGPGSSETVEVHTLASNLGTLSLSTLSMLVNTNDAFTALNGYDISSLGVNESIQLSLNTYDSGTEANSETADTVPGPAATGGAREGFNTARDDVRDAIYMHPGVVTQDDGLASSTLNQANRWDQPVAMIRIERTL